MKIREIRALRGPNYYASKPVIFMELDLMELESCPTDMVPGFKENILSMLPSIYGHTCSPGIPGGFIQRIQRGTWAGHVVEHIAIELQCLLGHDISFGKTFTQNEKGIYHVVYRYKSEMTGIRAGELAVEITEKLFKGEVTDIGSLIEELSRIEDDNELGPSTRSIVREAQTRGIPHIRLNDSSYVQLGYGKNHRRIEATITDDTSSIGVEIASDKYRTKNILSGHGIPVPKGIVVKSLAEAMERHVEIGFPMVLKPLDGNHGRGISTDVMDVEEIGCAYSKASEISRHVIMEKQLKGHDYRILMVNGCMVAAALREPANVMGNGKDTIEELIEYTNLDPSRGEGHERILTRIRIDDETRWVLNKNGMDLNYIPSENERIYVKTTANLSTGGTAEDVTDIVHPVNRRIFERTAGIIGLNIMGIDVVAEDITRPLDPENEGIVEVNAAPGFRMHLNPSRGEKRNVAEPVVDMLFPEGREYTIPICAVTGTNGKTTTTRLINHIMTCKGLVTGMTSTDGVVIAGDMVLKGDYSGPEGARTVFRDPTVEMAVLEVARGGILRRGLAYDRADVGVFLNVSSDHLGYGGIDTLEELARLKSTVTEAVKRKGYAVFNADDELVTSCILRTRGIPVLFSRNPENSHFCKNLKKGGFNVTVKDASIVIQKKDEEITLVRINDIPVTFNGTASFNIENCLAAAAAAYALGADAETIEKGLLSFKPDASQSSGRMNIIEKYGSKFVVDYGHNTGAIHATADYLRKLGNGRLIRMASGVGNRRTEDIIEFGETISKYYDFFILCDSSPRGRRPMETAELVKEGLLRGGVDEKNIIMVESEKEATKIALDSATPGDVVVFQAEDIKEVLHDVNTYSKAVY